MLQRCFPSTNSAYTPSRHHELVTHWHPSQAFMRQSGSRAMASMRVRFSAILILRLLISHVIKLWTGHYFQIFFLCLYPSIARCNRHKLTPPQHTMRRLDQHKYPYVARDWDVSEVNNWFCPRRARHHDHCSSLI